MLSCSAFSGKKHGNSTSPSFLFFVVIDLHMDEYIGKRASGGVGISKRGSGRIIRDAGQEDRSIPYCNRIGCSTRLYAMKSSEVCNEPRKSKCSRPFLRSSSNKWVPGSSSKPSRSTNDLRKIQHELKLSTSQKENFAIGSSNVVEQVIVSEPLSPIATTAATYEVGSSSASSNSRSKKKTRQRSALSNQDVPCGTSNSSSHTVKSTLQDSSHRKRRDAAKRQGLPDGESSSTRANNATGSFDRRKAWLGPGSSSAGRSASHQPLRRARPSSAGGNGMASVRSQRTVDRNTVAGVPDCESDNSSIITEPNSSQQPELSISELDVSTTSWPSPMELPSICESSNTPDQSVASGQTLRPRPAGHLEDGGTWSSRRMPYDRDGLRRFHMEGISEVLFALDRSEHDAELTYEQLLVLETNLLLGGSSFHDQHRDMRMDIDNMSYEELLALEEKMGTVSTALTEEQLTNCLQRSIYTPGAFVSGDAIAGHNDVKCSICQEEYVEGDEVGKLVCSHWYHVICIHEWLRLKNWCPICKAAASQS